MTKEQFVTFLSTYEKEHQYTDHWACVKSGTFDYWKYCKPSVDWLEDDIDLSKGEKVVLTYNKLLYDNSPAKQMEFTYEDFLKFMRYPK